jgi:hypothetical protein
MNSAQHQVFNMLVQGAHESRADLHSIAQDCLGILILGAILVLGLIWIWILTGGLSKCLSPGSTQERKALENWLAESRPRV